MDTTECWRCCVKLPGEEAQEEEAIYCGPCRSIMILPCDRCGGVYDRSGNGMPECPDCGMRCGYWEDCDLVDPEDVVQDGIEKENE